MNEQEQKRVDGTRIAFEITASTYERTLRLVIVALVIVAVAALCAITAMGILMTRNNARWLEAWESYDYASSEITVDGADGGDARYIGDNSHYVEGDVNYGDGHGEEAQPN